jgi:hypothetical protein
LSHTNNAPIQFIVEALKDQIFGKIHKYLTGYIAFTIGDNTTISSSPFIILLDAA